MRVWQNWGPNRSAPAGSPPLLAHEDSQPFQTPSGEIGDQTGQRCCGDTNHVENYDIEDFESEDLDGVESYKRLLENWAIEHNLNYRVLDARELADLVEPVLKNRTTTSGIPL